MKQQRGIATGWLYLIALVVVLGLVLGIIAAVKDHLEDVDEKAYTRGVDETTAAYTKRDNAALAQANAEIQRLHNEARARELEHANKLAAIAAQRAKEKADASKQKDSDRTGVRSGALELRDPGAAGCPAPGGGRPGPQAGAGAGGGDGKAAGKLSDAAAEFLLDLVNDADDVARQLARAQEVIEEQIRTCNK